MNQFREGIYQEEKKGSLGTGDTAATIVYKNLYAVRLSGDQVEMFLLDDNLALTGLREGLPLAEFLGRYRFQAQLQKRYQELSAQLGPGGRRRPVPGPKTAAPLPQKRPEAKPPQVRQEALPPQTRPKASPPAKSDQDKHWWDATRKGAERLLKKD